MLPRFAIFNRFLISSTVSGNIRMLFKPASYYSGFYALQPNCSYTHELLHQPNYYNVLTKRLKKIDVCTSQLRAKSSKRRRSEEYESDSDSDEEVVQTPGSKLVQIQTESLRCDKILKQGLGLSRNKLEVQFYEGRIRVNGKKILKKSVDVQMGDEIDLIKGVSEDNPKFIIVSRVEVLKGRPTGDVIILTVRKHKSLLIENYESHPWEEPVEEKSDKDLK